jgi:hypothetical protein
MYARVQGVQELPEDVILAVNAKGLMVVHPDTKNVLTEFSFKWYATYSCNKCIVSTSVLSMQKWGHSKVSFMLVVNNHPLCTTVRPCNRAFDIRCDYLLRRLRLRWIEDLS